jgi:myb proto-oncogene protein/Myb-like DNA-binding protein BAS1
LYHRHGPKWSTIAREIPGRTDDACSKRYREALDPNLKKGEWTTEEDEELMKLHNKFGEKWGLLGQELQRSGLGCRNRYGDLTTPIVSVYPKTIRLRLLSRKASKVPYDAANSQVPDLSDSQHIRTNPSQSVSFHVDVLLQQPHWPPYYPPEAYSYLSQEENLTPDSGFREPTPEVVSHSPHEAPFNFSSSSLSAALSDPPRIPMALPPIAECDHLSSVEASSSRHELIYHQMSLDDLPIHSEEEQRKLALISSRPSFGAESGAHYDTSLFSSPIGTMPTMDNDGWDNFPADFLSLPVYEPSSLQILDGLFTDPSYSDASSSLSTPSHFPTSLSASSSPNGGSPNELPLNNCRAVISSLPTDNRKQPPRRSAKKAPKKQVKPQGPTRLSSMLALTPE